MFASCKIGPKEEEFRTTKHRVVNKVIWLIGTSRNALLVVLCGLLGWSFQDNSPIRLIGTRSRHDTIFCNISRNCGLI